MIRGVGSGVFSATFKGVNEKGDPEDKTVWFAFGTLASAYAERESKLNIFEMFDEIAKGHGSLSFLHYFYGGALAHADIHKTPRPDLPEVVRWLELMGEEKALDIYTKSLVTFLPKNVEAPETGQQMAV